MPNRTDLGNPLAAYKRSSREIYFHLDTKNPSACYIVYDICGGIENSVASANRAEMAARFQSLVKADLSSV